MDTVTDDGMKLKATLQTFGILATPFRYHLYNKIRFKQRGNLSALKSDEGNKLVDYNFKMQDLGHQLIPVKFCLKLALATKTKEMP